MNLSLRAAPTRRRRRLSLFLSFAIIASYFAIVDAMPARALSGKVAILSTTVTGGASSLEAQRAMALGLTVDIKTPTQWSAMTAPEFAEYRALILGDPDCATGTSAIAAAVGNRAVWGSVVDGNVVVIGTDPRWHAVRGRPGGGVLTERGIAFAADVAGKTGMYITLSCYYHGVPTNTPVPLLDPFGPGAFTVRGVGCFNNAHIVASHPALAGLTDAALSDWSCSVHEAFDNWASDFSVLAIARGIGGTYTAADGSVGTPYIIARGEGLSASDIQLSPPAHSAPVGSSHTLTATVTSGGTPVSGELVTFNVLSGPHAGTSGTDTTGADGKAQLSYVGTSPGVDTIRASFERGGITQVSNVATMEWIQADTPPTVVIESVSPSGDEGSPISLDATVTDDKPGVVTQWFQSAGPGVDAGAACSFADDSAVDTTITCTDDGTFVATLVANDGVNPPVSASVEVTVANVAPELGPISAPLDPIAVGTAISATAPFSDDGSNDTHTCSVNWGDASSSAGSTGGGTCSAGHTYTAAGVYTLEMTVVDDDGASAQRIFQYVVVYDPAAGFVTGGGWVVSPAGAFTADPTRTGRANFGFVSKYQKGAKIPTGNTQFQFQAGNLNFHSTSYDWLVISGPKAQYKGSGTINGAGNYGFLLTANDGQTSGGGGIDRFRIKIWDKDNGNQVVYDNQTGSTDDAAATDAIEGGSIVIHSKN